KPLRIQTNHFATVRNVVETFIFYEWRRTHSLIRPIVHPAGGKLFRRGLPEKFPVCLAERHQHPSITGLFGVAYSLIVGTCKDHAASHNRVPISLRTQSRYPLDILFAGDVPTGWQSLHVRKHVSIRRTAPHWPISRARIGCRH